MNTGTTKYAEFCYSTVINDIDALERNVKDYPASSLARFLLLYHYKKNGHPGFEKFASQTGVYLNNPYWIQYQLSQADVLNEREISNTEIANVSTIAHPPIVTEEVENDAPKREIEENLLVTSNEENKSPITSQSIVTEEVENDASSREIEENSPVTSNEENESPITHQSIVTEEVENYASNRDIEENLPVTTNEENVSAITHPSIVTEEVENHTSNREIEENSSVTTSNEENESPITLQSIVTEEVENYASNREIEEVSSGSTNEENVSTIANQALATYEVENDALNPGIEAGSSLANKEEIVSTSTNQTVVTEEAENDFDINDDDQNQSVKEQDAIIAFQPAQDAVDNDFPEDEQIAFEPLHTVDYFASQGIKITREELEKDHLGKQVKSFTAWLKSMKKLHPGQVPEQNEVIEKIIQTSSEISNQNANVLTEAMAEVLVKQDKREKAIEMYQKLSLINPSKSAYFAAKIESLKFT